MHFNCQNHTIAELVREFDAWKQWYESHCNRGSFDSCGPSFIVKPRVHTTDSDATDTSEEVADLRSLRANLSDLARSLGPQIETSIAKRWPPKLDAFRAAVLELVTNSEQNARDNAKEMLEGMTVSMTNTLHDSSATIAANVVESSTAFVSKVVIKLDHKIAGLSARIDNLHNLQELPSACGSVSATHGLDSQYGSVSELCNGAFVRLCGLKSVELNGKPGAIIEYNKHTQRYGVNLHGSAKPIAVKTVNLSTYHPDKDDFCMACSDRLNLCAFPPRFCNAPDDAEKKLLDDPSASSKSPELSSTSPPSRER